MAEKTFNVRILNKIDTLERWQASDLKIKNGEICIATVAASEGTGLTEPVCMIKIGTEEEKTFAELPWAFYAKASDVVTAAKSEEGLRAFINGVIADAGIASDDAMQELAGKVTTLEGTVGDAESGLVKGVADNAAAITALQALVGDEVVADQIAEAIEAALKVEGEEKYALAAHAHEIAEVNGLADAIADAKKAGTDANGALEAYKTTNDAAVQKVADDLAAEVQRATGIEGGLETRLQAVEAKFGDGEGNVEAQIAAAVAAEAKEREDGDKANTEAIEALADKVGEVTEGKTVVQMISDAQTAATYDDTEVKNDIAGLKGLVGDTSVADQIAAEAGIARAAEKANADAIKAIQDDYLVEADKTELQGNIDALTNGAVKTNTDAIATLNGNSSVEGSVDKKVADAINAFATQVSDDQTVNTYRELINYAATHGAEFTELVGEVDGNAKAIETLNGDVNTAGSVDKKIADAIAAENLGQYATDGELTALADRVTTVENELNTEETGLKARMTTAEGEIATLKGLAGDSSVADQITAALKVDGVDKYALATELDIAEGKIEALEADTHTHANKEVLDGIEAADITAWDAKVDSVTAVENGGIKATRTGNVIALELDDTITYVFNCGTSAE